MSDVNSSPVSLPAGSYEYDTLKRGLDKAAKGSAKNYPDAVANAIDESSESVHETVDPRATPGYVLKEVAREDLGVTETIQVYDPKREAEVEEDTGSAILPQPTTPVPADGAASKE